MLLLARPKVAILIDALFFMHRIQKYFYIWLHPCHHWKKCISCGRLQLFGEILWALEKAAYFTSSKNLPGMSINDLLIFCCSIRWCFAKTVLVSNISREYLHFLKWTDEHVWIINIKHVPRHIVFEMSCFFFQYCFMFKIFLSFFYFSGLWYVNKWCEKSIWSLPLIEDNTRL